MDTPNNPVSNRVGADLKTWEQLEKYFAKKYGADMFNDRPSQKVKRDMYGQILRKYRRQPKNDIERMEMKMLRAQHRSMNRRLYPNPWVRLARNVTLLGLNVAKFGLKQLFKVLKFIINPTTGTSNQPAVSVTPPRPPQQNNAPGPSLAPHQQTKGNTVKNGKQQHQRGAQTKTTGQKQPAGKGQTAGQKQTMKPQKTAKVRNLNPRQMVPAGTSKGMRRG